MRFLIFLLMLFLSACAPAQVERIERNTSEVNASDELEELSESTDNSSVMNESIEDNSSDEKESAVNSQTLAEKFREAAESQESEDGEYNRTFTTNSCREADGWPTDFGRGKECKADEYPAGVVEGYWSEHICCIKR